MDSYTPTPTTDEPLAVLSRLRDLLGPAAVLIGIDVPARNCNDWSTQPPQTPIAVVRPNDATGVSAALKACRAAGLSVVPQGGLTGLCGGARPEPGWVALSMERMVGVEEIDAASSTMTVWAGTPLEAVQRAASDAGFYFALDLGARGSCAIGGNLSTNAGGNRVIRYGMARELVLGLEVVLPDGTIVTSLNKMLKNNAGYDLKHLFIGSEGTLGVITRIVLRLHPQPQCTLSAFEVMWPDYWQVVTKRVGVRAPVADGHGFYVLVEAQGTDDTVDGPRFQRWLEKLLEDGALSDAALAQSVADTQSFWALRDACAEFFPTLGPHISYDVGLAVKSMDAYAVACKAALMAAIPGCESVYYGHVGDGNLHLVSWVPGLSVEQQPKEAMDEVIYTLVREFGGTVSAEHGIGTVKKKWLGHARSPEEIVLMKTIKRALDPQGLLNPGKVV
ncbi:MAG: FAD-binding oxidoreductase [Burkholderiaceae bacterium]|nr:FAD-binding oxidoreductase [Burkholderiaceae bacterium]